MHRKFFVVVMLMLFAPFHFAIGDIGSIDTPRDVTSANARRIHVGGNLLPDTSFYVPNSFPNTSEERVYGFLNGISRVRNSRLRQGCEPGCSDAVIYLEADVWKNARQSLSLQYSVHSLTSRNGGTSIGEGQSIGFKLATALGASGALSFSGEHVLQLDNTVDLGRNLFLGYSAFVKRKLLGFSGLGYAVNVGLGTGLYTIYENTIIETGEIFGGNNIASATGDADSLTWGPIGSVSYYFNDRISAGAEFIGFGFGAGLSVKPFKNTPLTLTGYLYDLVDDFPEGIPCAESPCQPRLYGRVSYSF